MTVRTCPHCGNLVSAEAKHCACGFPFPADGRQVPGPRAAREVAERASRPARKPKRPKKSAGRNPASDEPAHEPSDEPAPASDGSSEHGKEEHRHARLQGCQAHGLRRLRIQDLEARSDLPEVRGRPLGGVPDL
jgi:hypothetical protein